MYEYRCEIVRVVDGDTIDVNIDLGFDTWIHKERIRLKGIDTPESRTRDLEEKKYGLAAKAFVEEQMPVGSDQILQTQKDKTGKFGRILGVFIVNNRNLNELMIQEHHAVSYYGQPKNEIAEAHLKNRELVEI